MDSSKSGIKNLVGDRDALVIEFKAEKGGDSECVFGDRSKVSSENTAVLKLNNSSKDNNKLVMRDIKTSTTLKAQYKDRIETQCKDKWTTTSGWTSVNMAGAAGNQLKFLVHGLLTQYRHSSTSDENKIKEIMERKGESETSKGGFEKTGKGRFKESEEDKWFDWAIVSKENELTVDSLEGWGMGNPSEILGNCWSGFTLGDDSRWNWAKTENRNTSSADWTTKTGEGDISSECNNMKGNEYVFKLRTYSFSEYINF